MTKVNDIPHSEQTDKQKNAVKMFRKFTSRLWWTQISTLIIDKKLNILVGIRQYSKDRYSVYCEYKEPKPQQSTLQNAIDDYSVLYGEFFFKNDEFDVSVHKEYEEYAKLGYGWFAFSLAILDYHRTICDIIEKNKWIE